jgi:hypothetical protein
VGLIFHVEKNEAVNEARNQAVACNAPQCLRSVRVRAIGNGPIFCIRTSSKCIRTNSKALSFEINFADIVVSSEKRLYLVEEHWRADLFFTAQNYKPRMTEKSGSFQ